MSKGRKYHIEGRVQGVWFRESTRRQAESLGITGHAVNLSDGSVEVVAFGSERALAELEKWLQEGPPMARVDAVAGSDVERTPPERFTTG